MTADTRDIPASSTLLGISTNVVVKGGSGVVSPGIVRRVSCIAQNTANAYILDGTSTASSAAATVWQIGSAGMAVGAVTVINFPVNNGIAFIPGGGTFSLAWD